ncbi:MAG: aminotransferase class IV [Nocardiopsaceae bacterium]|nr:aminotransferase class IV [Nocardiopsaceae bacterium]
MAELNGVAADVNLVKALALTNYGHFTSMRIENQRVRGLSLHLERLMRDCRRVFEADLDPERVRYLVRRVVADISQPIIVRVTIFDPTLELGHLGADAIPHILVTTRPAPQGVLPGLRLQSASYRRDMPEVKHVGLFGALRLRRIAQRNGFDDVVFTDANAVLSEVATSNIGFVQGDHVVWPRADYLPGVTMRLINQAREEHVTTAPITLADLTNVDAVFATNAAVGVRLVSAINDVNRPADHPTLRTLGKQYADIPPERL